MTSQQIRQKFLDFFASKAHAIVPSAPMVVKNDPTLMFTNAGMNQFKDKFLGNEPAENPRVADSQKCLRVSGKHNDLSEVGHDTYHHTMFEMLGNWSFADYFKKEAIGWAWELLVGEFKLDPTRIYATVFEGNAQDGVPFDGEAFNLWKQYLPESHILRGNKKDNFWEMGASGPCGPCSEVHYDLREDTTTISGAELVNKDNPEVIEIWNLVFMQFNRLSDGKLVPLPACHVDTGMGFERLCMIIQGKRSNYDTDVFSPLLSKISELQPNKNPENKEMAVVAQRVIADHLRAIAFSIAEGQLPSNNKAGYVIRRILRRAVRYGYTYLGVNAPFICELVPTLVAQMGEQYPELKKSEDLIEKVIREEENTFLRTLATGINLIENGAWSLENGMMSGKDAFLLYDTYGFPLDLTELIMEEKGIKIDLEGFEKELAQQKARSRSAAVVENDDWVELNAIERSEFVGYDCSECSCKVARYRRVTTKNKRLYHIVLDKTPFYGASGGQVGDTGELVSGDVKIAITDTIKDNNLTIHIAPEIPSLELLQGEFLAKVNTVRRAASAANHSATHLMHQALREVLGSHVEQKGSMVTPEYLRFDFSHFAKVTPEELRKVEKRVNELVRTNHRLVENRNCSIEEAQKMGAMMLFGEKYGSSVRTIAFGESVELCGGIHVEATGSIGLFRILCESSSSAGVRRIEAITALRAEEWCYEQQKVLDEFGAMLGTKQFAAGLQKLLNENSAIATQMNEIRTSRDNFLIKELMVLSEEYNGYAIVCEKLKVVSESVRNVAQEITKNNDNAIVILSTRYGDRPSICVALGANAIKAGLKAGDIVKEAARAIGGGGGGQANFAMAGGKNVEGIEAALNIAIAKCKEKI
ncbi:MAG: alanine--tRNA ligase [Rikenellaceae bacterium]